MQDTATAPTVLIRVKFQRDTRGTVIRAYLLARGALTFTKTSPDRGHAEIPALGHLGLVHRLNDARQYGLVVTDIDNPR